MPESKKLMAQGFNCVYEIGFRPNPDFKAEYKKAANDLFLEKRFPWRIEGDLAYVTVGKRLKTKKSCETSAKEHAKLARLSRNDRFAPNPKKKAKYDLDRAEKMSRGEDDLVGELPDVNLGFVISIKAKFHTNQLRELCNPSLCPEEAQPKGSKTVEISTER